MLGLYTYTAADAAVLAVATTTIVAGEEAEQSKTGWKASDSQNIAEEQVQSPADVFSGWHDFSCLVTHPVYHTNHEPQSLF